ncbi:Unknown protein sequence [Pseudomonas syringae pv. cilantro]|uniref:Uncharacterized protein n=1 Tax=Pseudomonas syringae pv. cilantro TaxID=81035 RepID=A0A0N0GGP0_PSESX|nr:Unknown protein sequence [Pseudomonas syringae pv. cilantro]
MDSPRIMRESGFLEQLQSARKKADQTAGDVFYRDKTIRPCR